ncbi:hypothetical protein D3C81_1868220 [compost metagenome]
MEARLTLPHLCSCTAVAAIARLREVLPRLPRQGVELHGPLGKLHPVEGQTTAQHAAQVFAGLEHVLEDHLTLAQRRIRVNTVTGIQGQGCEQNNGQSLEHHGHYGLRKWAASIAAQGPNTNSHIKNRGEYSSSPVTGSPT